VYLGVPTLAASTKYDFVLSKSDKCLFFIGWSQYMLVGKIHDFVWKGRILGVLGAYILNKKYF